MESSSRRWVEPTALVVGAGASLLLARAARKAHTDMGLSQAVSEGLRSSVFYMLQFPPCFAIAALRWKSDWFAENPPISHIFGFVQAGLWLGDLIARPSLAHLCDPTEENITVKEDNGPASMEQTNGASIADDSHSRVDVSFLKRLQVNLSDIKTVQWLDLGVLAHHCIVIGVFGEVLWKRRFLLFYQYWAIGFGGLFDFIGNLKPIVTALGSDMVQSGADPFVTSKNDDKSSQLAFRESTPQKALAFGRRVVPKRLLSWYPGFLRVSFLWLRVVQPPVQYLYYVRDLRDCVGLHVVSLLNIGVVATVLAMGLDKTF